MLHSSRLQTRTSLPYNEFLQFFNCPVSNCPVPTELDHAINIASIDTKEAFLLQRITPPLSEISLR
ncbi:hypothetical protein HYPBUDRAFT_152774 [Hyphopichia burtonii NRRL Y-1933]|uniref:Uncharacterized protein n=1 Tax=Hyphopichia burtonii NRRL Y-1933 TaxID=984485 RepID=A0A1E4RLL5_9ASCO|nr:hypothetical protein HYPBUDRAFT_152774 [Hyphopichia burtonii NRRL Y-1933]ODV68153.1 hypothetical protein HYPBUDRAFT_152774 [Hyphopichia burtonii NRRL Y-1933]